MCILSKLLNFEFKVREAESNRCITPCYKIHSMVKDALANDGREACPTKNNLFKKREVAICGSARKYIKYRNGFIIDKN